LRLLTDLPRDEKGAIMVIFALILVPLLIFVSMAIDMARANSGGQRLQAALDSAALAGARYRMLTEEERSATVHSFFKANWDTRTSKEPPRVRVDVLTDDNVLKVSADVYFDALFFPLPGLYPFTLHRESYVKIGRVRLLK